MYKVIDSFQVPVDIIIRKNSNGEVKFALVKDINVGNRYWEESQQVDTLLKSDSIPEPIIHYKDNRLVYHISNSPYSILNGNLLESPFTVMSDMGLVDIFYHKFIEENDITDLWDSHYLVMGNVDEDNSTMDMSILEKETYSDLSYIYMFQFGYGQDGGFGDYSQPHWSAPITLENSPLFVDNSKEALGIVSKLNELSRKAFYSDEGEGSKYGDFPMEYKFISFPCPENFVDIPSVDKDVFGTIKEMHQHLWFESEF